MNTLLRKITRIALKAARNPHGAIYTALGLLRGSWYIVRYSIFNNKIKIAFPFTAFAPVTLKGPGSVFIDKGCSAHLNVFEGLTIVTLNSQAEVFIGRGNRMGGLTIRCARRVRIGNECLTSTSLIQDSLLVNMPCGGLTDGAAIMEPQPVSIGNNVWLGGQSCVLSGSRIGNDCVLSAGSVTRNADIKEYRLVIGNPSAATLPIDKILAWEERA